MDVFKEVLMESIAFYFIWLGLPMLLYGIWTVAINIPTIKARKRRKDRDYPVAHVAGKVYPSGREVKESDQGGKNQGSHYEAGRLHL